MSDKDKQTLEELEMDSEPYKTFKKKLDKWGVRLTHSQINELSLDAADVYAHPTRPGWCCACEADIAFAMDYIKDEPEFKQLLEREVTKARKQELLKKMGR